MKSLIASALMLAAGVSAEADPVYSFGHKVFALAPNASGLGQAITVTDEMATVIGQGVLPTPDFQFGTQASMLDWCKTTAASNAIASFGEGLMLAVTNDADTVLNGPYYVRDLNAAQDPTTGWADLYQLTPHGDRDAVIRGKRNWNYGRSMGAGTFNIMAVGNGVVSNGLATVYVNGVSLAELTGIHAGEPTLKMQYKQGVWSGPVKCAADYTVEIGAAHATETYSGNQAIAIGRDAISAGSATTAVGPNSFAQREQSVAIGWRANAVGAHSISIGGAKKSGIDYYTPEGTVCPTSDLQLAEGDYTVAVGYNNKARAKDSITIGNEARVSSNAVGAVQLGTGENTTPNTLKFQNVVIVKDGHVTGAVPEPQQVDPTAGTSTEELEFTVDPGSITTVLPTKDFGPGTELSVACSAANNRNYTIFLPNEPQIRAGLPGAFQFDLPSDVKGTTTGPTAYTTLPVRIAVEQPYGKLVAVNVTPLDDGYDWTPSVTNHTMVYRIDAGKGENRLIATNATMSILGESLHCATNVTLTYLNDAEVPQSRTVQLLTLPAGKDYMSKTLFGYAGGVDLLVESSGWAPKRQTRPDSTQYVEGTLTYGTTHGSVSTNIVIDVELVD